MRSSSSRAGHRVPPVALLFCLATAFFAVVNATDAADYSLFSYDTAYADSMYAKVECFLSKAWTPLGSVASAFKSDLTAAPRADSPWQVDDNATLHLTFFTFRSTQAQFFAMFAGFESGKFIGYRREGSAIREPTLLYIKDENSTCSQKPYNLTTGHCRFTYYNTTSQLNGAVIGRPSEAIYYNARVRGWYVGAKADETYGGTVWTNVYGFASGDVGITAGRQLVSSSGNFLGVVGIDIQLKELNSILAGEFASTAEGGYTNENDVDEPVNTAFIVDESENLVATSEPGYSYRNGSQVPAVNCSYKTIAATARFFRSQVDKGYADDTVKTLRDHAGDLLWARSLAYVDEHGLRWHIVFAQRVSCPFNYFAYNGTCEKCTFPLTSEGKGAESCTLCATSYYMDPQSSTCVKCKIGMACEKYGVSLETMRVRSGWYRFSGASERLYRCPYPSNCVGNTTDGDRNGLCRHGSFGPLCALCGSSYYLDTRTDSCEDCESSATSPEVSALYAIAGLCLVVCAAFAAQLGKLKEYYLQHREAFELTKKKLTALVITMQIIALLRENQKEVGGAALPEPFEPFLVYMSFLGLNIMDIASLACVFGRVQHLQMLLTSTLAPTAIVAVVAIAIHFTKNQKTKKKLLQITTFIVVMLLPIISRVILKTFRCISYRDGDGASDVLRVQFADPNVDCDDSSGPYTFMVAYAAVNVLIWPVGVPLGLMIWLRRIAKHLDPPGVSEAEAIQLRLTNDHVKDSAIAYIALTYRPRYWFYEICINLPRRLLLTCFVLVFSTRGAFILFVVTVSVLTTLAEREMYPHIDDYLGAFVHLNSWMILLCIIAFLYMNAEIKDVPDSLVGAILLLVNLLMVIFVFTDTRGDIEREKIERASLHAGPAKDPLATGSPSKDPSGGGGRSKNRVLPVEEEYRAMKEAPPATDHTKHQHQMFSIGLEYSI